MFLDGQDVLRIEAAQGDAARRDLMQQVSQVREHMGSALLHFGYRRGRAITGFDLVKRWREVIETELSTSDGGL